MKYKNKIYCGDALTILKQLATDSIDAGITSPPYNKKEKQKGWLVKNVVYDGYRDIKPEAKYQQEQIALLDELYRVIKPGGSFFYNHKLRWDRGVMLHPMQWLSGSRWQIRQEIIWDRGIAANIRGWRYWQVEERLYWLCKPPVKTNTSRVIARELPSRYAKMTSIWRIRPERDNPHPAPFPLALPVRALASVLDNKNSVIIDPYAGSGTALLAASLLEHRYIGIDISAKYCNYARQRLKRPSARELAHFNNEISHHRIQKTFQDRKARNEHVGRHATRQTADNLCFSNSGVGDTAQHHRRSAGESADGAELRFFGGTAHRRQR